MAGVGIDQFTGRKCQDTQPDRHEHVEVIVLTELVIQISEDPRGTALLAEHERLALDEGLTDHHIQRRRNTFAGDICDDKCDMVVIDQVKIVEITADFFCRGHGCIDIEIMPVRERREHTREHVLLDDPRHVEFALGDGLLFSLIDIQDAVHQKEGHHRHIAER